MSTLRQSESCWVSDGQSDLVDGLNHRMNWITGLQTSALLDPEGKKEEYEYLQLASYGTGGYYRVHQVELTPQSEDKHCRGKLIRSDRRYSRPPLRNYCCYEFVN